MTILVFPYLCLQKCDYSVPKKIGSAKNNAKSICAVEVIGFSEEINKNAIYAEITILFCKVRCLLCSVYFPI